MQKQYIMARNTSILLGEYFENYIHRQIASGKYSSVSEVVRAALRVFEQEENKAEMIVSELEKGERSKTVENFDRKQYLEELHSEHIR